MVRTMVHFTNFCSKTRRKSLILSILIFFSWVKPWVFVSVAKSWVKLGLIFGILVRTVVHFTNFCSKTPRKSLILSILVFFLSKIWVFVSVAKKWVKLGPIFGILIIFCSKTLEKSLICSIFVFSW